MTKTISFRVDKETLVKFRSLVKDQGLRFSFAVTEALEMYIGKHGMKAQPQEVAQERPIRMVEKIRDPQTGEWKVITRR